MKKALLAALIFSILPMARGQFYPTNLAVLRAGNGSGSLGSSGNPIFVDQYSTNGALVNTVAIPSTGTSPSPLIIGGSAGSEGQMTRSLDKRYIVIGGYNTNLNNVGSLSGSTSTAVPRGVAVVDFNGNYTFITNTIAFFSANNMRSAASDGTNIFWGAGAASGLVYVGTNLNQVAVETTNTEVVNVFNGKLYFSSQKTATVGIWGYTGLPTAAGGATLLINAGSSSSLLAFTISPDGHTVYIADGRVTTSSGGVQKWTNNAGPWTLAYTFGSGTNANGSASTAGARGVTADFSGTYPIIYATTTEGQTNRLISITDSNSSATATLLATAAANEVFTSVQLAPQGYPPSISAQPQNQNVTAGQSASFSVTASGSGTLAYQWRSNTVALAGATDSAYSISDTDMTDDGSYDVVITNTWGAITSSVATLTVNASGVAPGISIQPASQTVLLGTTVNFSVTASGTAPLVYQWVKGNTALSNGGSISGSTNSSLTIANSQLTDSDSYTVVITNGYGGITSSVATLTVTNPLPPVINTQPSSTTNQAGTTVTLSVSASGDGTLTYQWSFGGVNLSDGGRITGSSAATLTITNLQATDSGSYAVTVTNPGGPTPSATAILTVPAPSFIPYAAAGDVYTQNFDSLPDPGLTSDNTANPTTINGTNYSLSNPFDFAFYAQASGSGGLGLMGTMDGWYGSDVLGAKLGATAGDQTTGGILSFGPTNSTDSAANRSLGLLATSTTGGTAFGVRFINQTGETLNAINLAFTSELWRQTISAKTVSVFYYVDVNGTNAFSTNNMTGSLTTLSFPTGSTEWGTNGPVMTTPVNLPNQIISDWAPGAALWLVWQMASPAGSSQGIGIDDLNFSADLVVAPNITAGPATQTNNYGDTVTLSVSATGTPLFYSWMKGNTVLSDGGNISGSSTAILTLSPVASSDGATYTAIVSNPLNTNTASGVLTVNDPIIATPPTPQTAECGGSANFTVTANGTPTLAYQWYLGGTALTDGAGISGSSSSSLNLSSLALVQSGGQYSVMVTGSESVTSSVVSLTVQDTTPPAMTIIGATTTNVECGSSFTDPGAAANDACDGSTPVTTLGSVNTSVTGTYLLTYSSTDSSGNPGTAIRTVMVGDSTPPMITLIGASTTNIECTSSFTDPGATANDACAGSETVTTNGTVNTAVLGTYLITYTASDNNGNSATNTRTFNIIDTTAPAVTLNGPATTNIECHASFTDQGATANDTCAGSEAVTTSGTVDPNTVGAYILTYSATDSSTNTGTATLTVNIVDTTAPVVLLIGSDTTNVQQFTPYTDPGATASDTCAGTLAPVSSGVVDTNTLGTYYVTYIATDPSGNSDTNTRTVNIVANTSSPGITTQPSSVTNNAGTTATFTVVPSGYNLTYHWYKGTNALSDGAAYAGSATASLTITNVLHASEGSYSVVITNDFGTTSSAPAVLTVVDPYVSVSPANTTNYIGSLTPTVFTATGAGTPTLHYQWYSSNTTTHVLAKLSGKTSASFSVTSFATSTPAAYVVVVTNQLSAPNSATATASLVIEPAVTIKTKPKATTTVFAGDNVLFTTAGNNTLQYQWSFVSGGSTNTLAGQTAASLSLTNAGPANMGTYDCTLTGLATTDGGETPPVASAVLVVQTDPQPKVSIVSPKNKAILTNNAVEAGISGSVTNPTMVIDGKLTDKGLVTDVAIVRTFPSALSAAATLFGGPAKQSWTNDSIVLADGTNVFNVFATNVSGNVGSNTLSVFSANTQQLTIVTIGSGTYKHVGSTTYGSTDWTGDTNAYPVLQNTRHYGIEAIPAANCIFSNWMNGATVVSTNPTYTLTMSSGLTLTANVPANPLANLAGVYNGMVTATNGLTNTAASGTIEVTVKSNYTKFAFPFSGKVVFNGTSYALSGGFNLDGQYTGQTVTGGFPVSMNVDWTSGSNQIYGTVAGNSFTAGLEITAPADTLADGAYYLPLPVDTGAWTNYGYATVGVTNGAVKVSGKTYDGGAFTQTTTVDKQGRIPFYTFSRAEIQAAGLTSGSPDNTNTISGTVAFNGGVVSLQSASATNGLPALGSTVTVGTNTVPVLGALYPQVATPTMAAGIVTLSYKSSLHAAVIKGYGIMNGANGVVGSIKTGNGGATYVPFTIK